MKCLAYLILIALYTNLYSQNISVEFLVDQKPYQSLINGINLTAELSELEWEEYSLNFDLPEKIYLISNDGSYEFTSVDISFDSYIGLNGHNIATDEEIAFDLFAFSDILTYRYLGKDHPDNTEITYLYKDDTSYIEFKNLTFYYDILNELSPISNFNLTVSIDHKTGSAKFHYGAQEFEPGTIQEYLYDPQNPRIFVGLSIFENWLTGYPIFLLQNSPSSPNTSLIWVTPDFDPSMLIGLTDLPNENLVYSFEILPPNSIPNLDNSWNATAFPNPGSGFTSVQISGNELTKLLVLDFTGRIVYQNNFIEKLDINTSAWEAGSYIFQLTNSNETKILKWIKH